MWALPRMPFDFSARSRRPFELAESQKPWVEGLVHFGVILGLYWVIGTMEHKMETTI